MALIADLAVQILERVPDVPIAEFDTAKRELAITEAMTWFVANRENSLIGDVVGTGISDIVLPAGFDHAESRITNVEYPVGGRPPTCLAQSRYQLYDDGSGTKVLLILDAFPAIAEVIRLTFTVPYTLATLPQSDESAVVLIGCSTYCDWIATHYADSNRGSMNLDSGQHETQQRSYTEMSQRFLDRAYDILGIDRMAGANGRSRGGSGGGGGVGNTTAAASSIVSFSNRPGGLTHA